VIWWVVRAVIVKVGVRDMGRESGRVWTPWRILGVGMGMGVGVGVGVGIANWN
jgi:hypothetical protein